MVDPSCLMDFPAVSIIASKRASPLTPSVQPLNKMFEHVLIAQALLSLSLLACRDSPLNCLI
jgi:hypothetical protein